MKFDSYTDRGVEAAAELVNRLTPGWIHGHQWETPAVAPARRDLAAAVERDIWGRSRALRERDADGLYELASRLRQVFVHSALGEVDQAAQSVNALLNRYHAAPQLAHHDGEPWHLHFQSQESEAGRVDARGATCATALAVAIGSRGGRRLGVCRAERCDRVFVDTSRNASRRFCSANCMSRSKVAAFRARRAVPAALLPGSADKRVASGDR